MGTLTRNQNMIISDISRNMGNIPMFLDMLNRFLEQQIRLACCLLRIMKHGVHVDVPLQTVGVYIKFQCQTMHVGAW